MATPKKSKPKEKLPADLLAELGELVPALRRIVEDPSSAALARSRDLRSEVVKSFYLTAAAICERNGDTTASLFPFVQRLVSDFGLAATDEALRTATQLCDKGSPRAFIFSQARAYFEKMGNSDAAFLSAYASLKKLRSNGLMPDSSGSEEFVAELVKPYTDRRIRALNRLEYYEIVKNHCRENPGIYDSSLVVDYFKELMASDREIRNKIRGKDDVPDIDFVRILRKA